MFLDSPQPRIEGLTCRSFGYLQFAGRQRDGEILGVQVEVKFWLAFVEALVAAQVGATVPLAVVGVALENVV